MPGRDQSPSIDGDVWRSRSGPCALLAEAAAGRGWKPRGSRPAPSGERRRQCAARHSTPWCRQEGSSWQQSCSSQADCSFGHTASWTTTSTPNSAQQQIFFPDKAGIAAQKSAEITKYVTPYASQQVLNGKQAQVFANHYIAVHLSELPMGGVYSKLSAASRANPSDQTLAAAVDTSFKGTTLRGMLLNAYAFWKMGQIACGARFRPSSPPDCCSCCRRLASCTCVARLLRRRCCPSWARTRRLRSSGNS